MHSTPGPWIAERDDKNACIVILGKRRDGNIRQSDKHGDVVTVDCAVDPDAVRFSPFNPEDEANAALIAMAPVLRDALRPFVEAYEKAADPIGDSDLYDEQPRSVSVTLGDCRRAAMAYRAALNT